MDALMRTAYKRGILLSEKIIFTIGVNNIEYSVADILAEYYRSGSKEEQKSAMTHIKNAPKEYANSFVKGLGQKQAIEKVYGKEAALYFEEIILSLTYTKDPIYLEIEGHGEWTMRKIENDCYLYQHEELPGPILSIELLIQRLLTFGSPEKIKLSLFNSQ